MNKVFLKKIQNVKKDIRRKVNIKLREFKKNSKASSEKKFLELCFCILVANMSIKKTQEVSKKINKGFICLSDKKLKEELKKLGYRFYNRSNYIILARKFIKEINFQLKGDNETGIREWLVKNIKGIGFKEASHFLRNLGFRNFAILDRHILKILNKYKVLSEIPKSLSKKRYLKIERKLKEVADSLHITLAELDLYLFYLDTGRISER